MHSKDMKGLIQTRNTSHLKRIDTSICITESLCCTRKTNKTWLINYTPIYKKKKRGVLPTLRGKEHPYFQDGGTARRI